MSQAKSGDTVRVHYTGTFEDGTQFDSSVGNDPLEVTLGEGQLIPGFEQALEGMAVGETKQISLPPEEAYGEPHPELIQEVGREHMPDDLDLSVGMKLQTQGPEGNSYLLTVTALTDETVTLDGNHEMAGKTLNFDLEMVSINA